MKFFKLLFLALTLLLSGLVHADANPELWPYIKERMFKDREILEADFIKLSGPKRASSGAQVPIKIELASPADIEMAKIYLIVDANPGQHAATYYLTKETQNLDLSTRIRMETDSFVRIIGEDSNGKLYMSSQAIRASGGCSGYMDVFDPELTRDLGKILVKSKDNFLTTRIKHPNFTGLQKDLVSQGFIPEWIITEINYSLDNKLIFKAENKITISQDPYLKFNLPANAIGNLNIIAKDTKGQKFTHEVKI
jgi:sulfur-oxidizing protein SoxY